MPEWLSSSLTSSPVLTLETLIIRIVASLILGIGVALIFRCAHGKTHPRAGMLISTLILLSVLIAMVSMVIGGSVALAFSLVGALSIVRFRTVVEDTRDTAFVIFAVVVGMGAGAGQLLIPLVGLPVVGAAAIVLNRIHSHDRTESARLVVRLGLAHSANGPAESVLTRHGIPYQLRNVSTSRQGSAIDLTFDIRPGSSATMLTLVRELNSTEGIQNVELITDAG